jgi:phage FluMu gp28-like protein
MISLETTHAAATRSNYLANIISTTQDEAAEKILMSSMLWASIPKEMEAFGLKPIKYQDSKDTIGFHYPPHTSRVMSRPGTSAIRGGKKDMYYDEAAYIENFPTLFQAGLPAITRGEGRITVVSTPVGESGLYHDLWKEPKWSHHMVPWWESMYMVKGADTASNPYEPVQEAMLLAPEMGTEDRIYKFGSQKLIDIFEVALRRDATAFQTEYECKFVDELESYYPYDLIKSRVDREWPIWRNYPEGYEPQGVITIGVDLAKEKDSTVFTVVEQTERDGITYKRVIYTWATQQDYDDQFHSLGLLIRATGAGRVSIDATGPGSIFHERADKEGFGVPIAVEGVKFTNDKKEGWATRFKGELQEGTVTLPNHPVLIDQIHGIKRTKLPSGVFKFAGEKDDYFWSMMLGMYGEGWRPVTFHTLGRR